MCAGLNSFGILACPARSLPLALCFSLFVTMVKITEVINKRGLNFRNQRKVMMYRAQKPPLAFSKIAELVRNMQKKPSTEDVCRRVYDRFNVKNGFVKYNYGNCGRTPWKITKEVAAFIVRQLKKDRRKTVCTSTTLQAALFKDMGVKVGTSAIRKCLRKAGYWWLPRAQKRKYSKEVMKTRRAFVSPFAARSQKVIHDRITFAMDGVVLTTPPTDPVERANYCSMVSPTCTARRRRQLHPIWQEKTRMLSRCLWLALFHCGERSQLVASVRSVSTKPRSLTLRNGLAT